MGLLIKLQNGDTALKSLKFGKDRPGGGDSGQPYIQDPILDNPLPESKDFLLRGGLNAPINAAEDVVRLTKYMFDLKSPSGLLFIAKQNLLSRTAPKTQTSTGIAYAGGAINGGIYTPLSTLAQAGVGFLGAHLNKQGIDPTGLIPGLSIKNYGDVVKSSQPSEDNRLVNLSLYSTTLDGIGINQGQDVLTYGGGPGSILGIGKTHIRYADQRTGVNNPLSSTDKQYFYKGGLVRPNSDIIIYNDKVTYGLGASKKEGLNDSQIGITEDGNYDPSTATGNPYNYTLPYSTLSKNSLGLTLSGSGGYRIGPVRPKTIVDYNNLLGASKKEGLTEFELGISENGTFNTLYNPDITYSTLSKNSIGLTLSGSGAYQTSRLTALQSHYPNSESYPTYVSPIETELEKINRELTSKPKFDLNTYTFEPTRSGSVIPLPKYSSSPSLKIDPNADEKGKTLFDTDIAERLGISNEEGYLANLNKNGGVNSEGATSFHNPYRVGGRGISNDFRQVNRKKRGFTDEYTSYDHVAPPEGQFVDYAGENTIDNIYYNSSSKRTSNPLNLPGDNTDIIPFRITIVNPESPSNSFEALNFRAYIDTFSDSYTPEWKSQTYMGRAEKQYKYNSFGRSISLGFTIVADNATNLTTMYNQLNTLAASLAPTYTSQGYMAGNLHRLTIGNYIYEQWGIIEGFTYEVSDQTPYSIKEGSQLPLYIKVNSIRFTPIHNFRPEMLWNKDQHRFINQHSTYNLSPKQPADQLGDTPVNQNNPTTLPEITVIGKRNNQ